MGRRRGAGDGRGEGMVWQEDSGSTGAQEEKDMEGCVRDEEPL